MRTRNELERLAAAGRPVLSDAESFVDAREEERILAGILASPRPAAFRRMRPRLRVAPAVIAAVTLAAAIAIGVIETGQGNPSSTRTGGHRKLALSGARIKLAGYRFKTPSGFTSSSSSCITAPSGSGPKTVLDGFAAAASAEGGCLEAFYLISTAGSAIPANAVPVDVGAYHGYLVSQDTSQQTTLYVELPAVGDLSNPYLMLVAQGLTPDELIAVALTGLPSSPAG